MTSSAQRILTRGIAIAVVLLILLWAAIYALDVSARRVYVQAEFHQIDGRWVP